MHETPPAPLQQSAAVVHVPPSAWHASVLTFAHVPFVQKPEQHSKPWVHAPRGGLDGRGRRDALRVRPEPAHVRRVVLPGEVEGRVARVDRADRLIDGGHPEATLEVLDLGDVLAGRDGPAHVAPGAHAREDDPRVAAGRGGIERRLDRGVPIARAGRVVDRGEANGAAAAHRRDVELAVVRRGVVAAVLAAGGQRPRVERDVLVVGRERRIRQGGLARRERRVGRRDDRVQRPRRTSACPRCSSRRRWPWGCWAARCRSSSGSGRAASIVPSGEKAGIERTSPASGPSERIEAAVGDERARLGVAQREDLRAAAVRDRRRAPHRIGTVGRDREVGAVLRWTESPPAARPGSRRRRPRAACSSALCQPRTYGGTAGALAGSSMAATSVVPSALTAWQPMHLPELSCTGCAPVPGAMRVMCPTLARRRRRSASTSTPSSSRWRRARLAGAMVQAIEADAAAVIVVPS